MTTEREMLNLLHRRFPTLAMNGGAPRYVIGEHVRANPDFTTRTLDAIAQDTWRSGRHGLIGFEVKCSRSDYLAELKDPSKSMEFRPFLRQFYVVVADEKIVKDDLPKGWGLLVKRGDKLWNMKTADVNYQQQEMSHGMRAAFVRSVHKTAQRSLARGVQAALDGDLSLLPRCEKYRDAHGCYSFNKKTMCMPCTLWSTLRERTSHGG